MSSLLSKFLGGDLGYIWLVVFSGIALILGIIFYFKYRTKKVRHKTIIFILDGEKVEEIKVKKGKQLVLTDKVKDYDWYVHENLNTKFSNIDIEEDVITVYSSKNVPEKENLETSFDNSNEELVEETIIEEPTVKEKPKKKTSPKPKKEKVAKVVNENVEQEKSEALQEENILTFEEEKPEIIEENISNKFEDFVESTPVTEKVKEEFISVTLSNDDGSIDDEVVIRVGSSVNKYIEKLNNLTPAQKRYYRQIKNELLAWPELLNTINKDGETFKFGNKTKFKINVVKKELKLFIDMDKEMLDKRYRGIEESELKKNKSAALEFTINEDIDLRKALSSIKKLIKSLNLYRKINYKNKSFKSLIKITNED